MNKHKKTQIKHQTPNKCCAAHWCTLGKHIKNITSKNAEILANFFPKVNRIIDQNHQMYAVILISIEYIE
jgi:hypothetical protein